MRGRIKPRRSRRRHPARAVVVPRRRRRHPARASPRARDGAQALRTEIEEPRRAQEGDHLRDRSSDVVSDLRSIVPTARARPRPRARVVERPRSPLAKSAGKRARRCLRPRSRASSRAYVVFPVRARCPFGGFTRIILPPRRRGGGPSGGARGARRPHGTSACAATGDAGARSRARWGDWWRATSQHSCVTPIRGASRARDRFLAAQLSIGRLKFGPMDDASVDVSRGGRRLRTRAGRVERDSSGSSGFETPDDGRGRLCARRGRRWTEGRR